MCVLGQGLVVEVPRRIRVEREIELILPAEFEACAGQRIVAVLRCRMPLRQIGRVSGYLVGNDALTHVVLVWQAEMLLGRDVAQHGGAEPTDHRRANCRGDVVVARRDVSGQGA